MSPQSSPSSHEPAPKERTSIEEALNAFHKRAEGRELAEGALKEYRKLCRLSLKLRQGTISTGETSQLINALPDLG